MEAGPWDERGRRTFRYLGSKVNRSLSMEQAIIEIGPHIVRYRGIDGFWVGVVETSQIPHPVIMSLVGRVDQKNGEERERVVRFLMDAGWYTEAREELDRIIQDFPKTELSQRAAGARVFIVQAEATQRRSELDLRRKAQQYQAVARLLKTFNDKDISVQLQVDIREIERHDLQQQAADKALAVDLRRLAGRLTPAARVPWQKAMVEVLKAIDEAPDAVRDRFVAWQKAKDDPKATDEARFALAMSGYVVGQDMAVSDLKAAEALWQARAAAARLPHRRRAGPAERTGGRARGRGLAFGRPRDARPHPPARAAHPDYPAHAPAAARSRRARRQDDPASRAGGRERRSDRVRRPAPARVSPAPQLPGAGGPAFRARARRRHRRVVRRGRAARLYPDRPRVQPARPTPRLSLHHQRARGRRAGPARRQEAIRHRQRPRLRRRPAHRRQHGLGLLPGAPRPVRRRGRLLRPARQVCAEVFPPPRAPPAVLRPGRAGPRGRRGRSTTTSSSR